ncbi:thiamine pyrophosphate-binding protein [Streptosporangium sp. NPDC004631]
MAEAQGSPTLRDSEGTAGPRVHQVLARGIADLGVSTLFGLMGDGNLWLIDSFVKEQGGTYVGATHEANAVLMASGFAQRSGGIGVATVTHGPGLTNTVTALTDAARGRIPMVVIAGDTPAEMRDHSQKLAQREVVIPTGAGFELMRSPATALVDLATAFRRAVAERRPVVLNIPRQLQLAVTEDAGTVVIPSAPQSPGPDPEALDVALGIVASARRPLILAGRGAEHARDGLVALADHIGALLATTLQGQSIFQGHAYDLGLFGSLSTETALEAIGEADCVISFGAGLNRHTTVEGALLSGKAVVQCDMHPEALGRYAPVDATVLGDAGRVAEAMLTSLVEAEIGGLRARDESLARRLAEERERTLGHDSPEGPLDVRAALAQIARAIPEGRSVTTDLGRFVIDAWKAVTVTAPRAYVHTNNFGSIGLGMGYAIGMTYARPDEPVVLVTGDGGFMMGGLAELGTAVRHGRDLIVVVVDDGAYGAEHVQFRNRGLDPDLTTFAWPDIAGVARALGAEALTVRVPADLDGVAEFVRTRRGPVLIDLLVAPEAVLARGFA